MSYFSINDFIAAGEKSLKDKNYWSALSVALTLPSMCSRIAFSDNEDNYKNYKWKDSSDHSKGKIYTNWKDKECYIDFCKETLKNQWIIAVLGEKYADILYQLRCDIIHAGIANIYDDEKGIYLSLGEFASNTEFSKYRLISIKDLCDTIFDHIKSWCIKNSINNFKYTFVFDTGNNNDDKLLYNRLCERDRADYLEEIFIQENEQRRKQ